MVGILFCLKINLKESNNWKKHVMVTLLNGEMKKMASVKNKKEKGQSEWQVTGSSDSDLTHTIHFS